MKNIGITLMLLIVSTSATAKTIRVDFESSINEIYVATPVGDSYEFERDMVSSDLAGESIYLGDTISGHFIYETVAPETQYSIDQNDPTYSSYYGLKEFNLNLGNIYLANPDDADYLAIYDNGLSSNIDAFYTSGSYRDELNFNIFRIHLFANPNLWDGLNIPDELSLDDFYYKKVSGAFLPNTNDLHLNWSGEITYMQTTVVPIPTAVWLFGSGLIGLIGFARRKA